MIACGYKFMQRDKPTGLIHPQFDNINLPITKPILTNKKESEFGANHKPKRSLNLEFWVVLVQFALLR